jgi:hypothetical protein
MRTEGQKVVCVNDRFGGGVREWGDQLPKRGHVYTVRSAARCPDGVPGIVGVGLHLEEFRNPGDRLRFSQWRFRLIVTELVGSAASAEAIMPVKPEFIASVQSAFVT